MYRVSVRSAIAGLVATLACSVPASAQSILRFSYDKVCDKTGHVEYAKLIYEIRSDVDANKFVSAEGFKVHEYQVALGQSILLTEFALQLRNERGRYYRVKIHGRTADTIDIPELVSNPSSHVITCVDYGKPPSSAAQRRVAVSKGIDELGKRLILRKDVDNLDKDLASGAPAQFSWTADRIASNKIFQSQFALATQFSFSLGFDPKDPNSVAGQVPLFIRPYIRHDGLFNTNNRAKDVDNLAGGVLATLYAVPLTSWLESSFSASGEFLSDTVGDKQIVAGEVIVEPISPADVKWPIQLQQRMYFDGVAGGPSIRFDLTGRVRYGWIEDNGQVATLQANTDYLRVGLKAGTDIDFGGSDALAGLGAYARVTYFRNTIEVTDLEEFYRFETGATYAFTKNFGLKIGYEQGRNEDTLQKVNRVTAGVTIKFGDVESNKPATLQ